ncbi:hypothetical protein AVEN_95309-1 [Araneus ventricosus]|uniref:Uncharacterized protein n=1 Tax=Araneus ventricosus TaxID=182803 RepID=A0A4Y2TYW3_ARAVE|nr:hypothetical protein AVEN_95309-1 [Araneus ventricosus]
MDPKASRDLTSLRPGISHYSRLPVQRRVMQLGIWKPEQCNTSMWIEFCVGFEKKELQGMLPVDGRQLENVKGDLLKLKKKEAADCNYGTTWPGQKNNEIADCQAWHNVGRREEPRKQKNKEIDDWQ